MGHGPHCCYFYFIVFEVLLGPNLKEKLLENSFSPCWSYYNIAITVKTKKTWINYSSKLAIQKITLACRCTKEYYTAMRINEPQLHTTWVYLTNKMLGKRSQTPRCLRYASRKSLLRYREHIFSLVCARVPPHTQNFLTDAASQIRSLKCEVITQITYYNHILLKSHVLYLKNSCESPNFPPCTLNRNIYLKQI